MDQGFFVSALVSEEYWILQNLWIGECNQDVGIVVIWWIIYLEVQDSSEVGVGNGVPDPKVFHSVANWRLFHADYDQ